MCRGRTHTPPPSCGARCSKANAQAPYSQVTGSWTSLYIERATQTVVNPQQLHHPDSRRHVPPPLHAPLPVLSRPPLEPSTPALPIYSDAQKVKQSAHSWPSNPSSPVSERDGGAKIWGGRRVPRTGGREPMAGVGRRHRRYRWGATKATGSGSTSSQPRTAAVREARGGARLREPGDRGRGGVTDATREHGGCREMEWQSGGGSEVRLPQR